MTLDPGEQKLTPRQIITAMSGLILAMLLAQLDNMIVAPALPTIVGDLGGLNHLSWVVTAYILGLDRRHADLGQARRPVRAQDRPSWSSVVIFLVGSALCGHETGHDPADRCSAASRASAPAG